MLLRHTSDSVLTEPSGLGRQQRFPDKPVQYDICFLFCYIFLLYDLLFSLLFYVGVPVVVLFVVQRDGKSLPEL